MATPTESAALRALQAYALQISEPESLEWGVAYTNPRFPHLPEANQLREIILEQDSDMPRAFESANTHFESKNLACLRWTPAIDQPLENSADYLINQGYTRRDFTIMAVREWIDLPTPESIRILPARAMRKTLTEFLPRMFADASETARTELVEAETERLNEPAMDGFIATQHNKPIGYAAFFEVGDIGWLPTCYVLPEERRKGVALALTGHALRLARRLLMRVTCTKVPASDPAALALCKKCGLSPDGSLTEFLAPGA